MDCLAPTRLLQHKPFSRTTHECTMCRKVDDVGYQGTVLTLSSTNYSIDSSWRFLSVLAGGGQCSPTYFRATRVTQVTSGPRKSSIRFCIVLDPDGYTNAPGTIGGVLQGFRHIALHSAARQSLSISSLRITTPSEPGLCPQFHSTCDVYALRSYPALVRA
jgi:hypothetical protein